MESMIRSHADLYTVYTFLPFLGSESLLLSLSSNMPLFRDGSGFYLHEVHAIINATKEKIACAPGSGFYVNSQPLVHD